MLPAFRTFGPFRKLFIKLVLSGPARASAVRQLVEEPAADIEKHASHEELECPRVGEVRDPDVIADEHARQGPHDHDPCQRPCHASFLEVAVDAARDGHDVIHEIRGTDGGAGEAEDAHLERQEDECAGYAGHGSEGGDDQGNKRRYEYPGFYA